MVFIWNPVNTTPSAELAFSLHLLIWNGTINGLFGQYTYPTKGFAKMCLIIKGNFESSCSVRFKTRYIMLVSKGSHNTLMYQMQSGCMAHSGSATYLSGSSHAVHIKFTYSIYINFKRRLCKSRMRIAAFSHVLHLMVCTQHSCVMLIWSTGKRRWRPFRGSQSPYVHVEN